MNYKQGSVSSEDVQEQVFAELSGYYYDKLQACIKELVQAKAHNLPPDFSRLEDMIEWMCDSETICIEHERAYDEESNLFL